jgi:hypothetical protein
MSYIGVDYRMSLLTNFVSIFAFNYLMEKHASYFYPSTTKTWMKMLSPVLSNSPHMHVKMKGYSFGCYEDNV